VAASVRRVTDDLAIRALTPDDRGALLELARAVDRAWWGAEETDPDEVDQYLELAGDLAAATLAVTGRDGELVAAALRFESAETQLLFAPTLSPGLRRPLEDRLIGWLLETGAQGFEALAQDDDRAAAYERHGIRRTASSYELERPPFPVSTPSPVWPGGIEVVPFDHVAHARAVYELLYSFWAETPTHHHRPFEEWCALLLGSVDSDVHSQVVAWRDGRPVGAAICRTYSGEYGWISQLGVARAERRRGLGRSLLTEASIRLSATPGVSMVGLAVAAENRHALELYASVGFTVTREWVLYAAPRPT
jgi:ribosomal protein S18 acetylase RimI-like enzyme